MKTKLFHYTDEDLYEVKNKDIKLASEIERIGRIERMVIPNIFQALVNAIIGQVISTKIAQSIWEKIESNLGEITPEIFKCLTIEEIKFFGLTQKKSETIKIISELVLNKELNLEGFYDLSDEEVIKELVKIKGIGIWTAEMILINSMERKDIMSFGDIAIKKGLCKVHNLESINKKDFEEYRKIYSPLGSIASIYFWKISAAK
ncbi:MAG: DNA-3-methyladenine glycosylase 2 family protein [Fusobacteria bacterium]|nr:DNA-3-methyladenine glycosylase 2 family protein [Fusobacteriota bacterium]